MDPYFCTFRPGATSHSASVRTIVEMQLNVYRTHCDEIDAEFATARSLLKVVGTEMGDRYERLVDKCLFLFGPDDLNEEQP